MVEWSYVVWNLVALVICRRQTIIIFSREVNDLNSRLREEGGGAEENLIDAAGTLAAASNQERSSRGIQSKNAHRFAAVYWSAEIFSDRGAGDNTLRSRKALAAILKPYQNSTRKFGC